MDVCSVIVLCGWGTEIRRDHYWRKKLQGREGSAAKQFRVPGKAGPNAFADRVTNGLLSKSLTVTEVGQTP